VLKAKVKVKLSLCVLTEHHAMKAYWGSGGIDARILDPALDGGEWSISCSGRYTARKRVPGTYWIGGWVGSRAGPTAVVRRNKEGGLSALIASVSCPCNFVPSVLHGLYLRRRNFLVTNGKKFSFSVNKTLNGFIGYWKKKESKAKSETE
jgi:hypothetical protein